MDDVEIESDDDEVRVIVKTEYPKPVKEFLEKALTKLGLVS